MRALSPVLIIFAAICIVAAGCSGGTGSGLPLAPNAATNAASNLIASPGLEAGVPDATSAACGRRGGCPAHVVTPLAFDGVHFALPSRANRCARTPEWYVAPGNKQFALASSVKLPQVCTAQARGNSRLFIAGVQANSKTLVIVGGPVAWSQKVWRYAPAGSGIAMIAKHRYAFFLIDMPDTYPYPSPGPSASPTGNYVLLQPLSFDGTTFTPVANACFQGDPYDAPPYFAPTSGPLAVSTVTVTPTCVPSPLPSYSPLPQLYVVAVQLGSGDNAKHAVRHAFKLPMDRSWGVPATAIGGPVNVTDNPWNFAADTPGLTMTGGQSYAFFIAAALPTPAPSTSPAPYDAIVPLDFDGTNFTVAAFSSCSSIGTPAPYTPTASGPLTLSAPVVVTPTCAPGSSGSYGGDNALRRVHRNDGGYGNNGAGQLFIVAVACSASSSSSSSSSGCGNGCGSSSSSSGCGGDGYGGGCSNGGGDNAKRPHDGQGGGGCTVIGSAIAGPVNATDDPWSFAPLTPALNLTAGTQYTFYIGVSHGCAGRNGGGD